jgi:hypothetical protein
MMSSDQPLELKEPSAGRMQRKASPDTWNKDDRGVRAKAFSE